MASYKSQSKREINVPKKGIPGVGDYSIQDHFSISNKGVQGGAPNNFTILSQGQNLFLRSVEIKE